MRGVCWSINERLLLANETSSVERYGLQGHLVNKSMIMVYGG